MSDVYKKRFLISKLYAKLHREMDMLYESEPEQTRDHLGAWIVFVTQNMLEWMQDEYGQRTKPPSQETES